MLGKEKATIIYSNMGGTTPRQLAKEFGAARKMRPLLQRACAHVILSIPHRDASHEKGEYHEHLNDEQYAEVALRWLFEMKFLGEGLNQSQYVIARHHDTDHEHIHIIASRIRMDSSVVSDSWDYRRSEVIVRQLEKQFGLSAAPCSSERVATQVQQEYGIKATVTDRRAQTQKQKHHTSSKPPVTQLLADIIDEATLDQPTVTELISRLQQHGVLVHPQFSSRGLFKEAIAFEMNGVKVAGNRLGSAYSFPGLQKKRGISYDPERDLPAIHACAAGDLVELLPSATEQLVEVSTPGEEVAATPKEIIQQENYISSISPIIRLFWHKVGQPKTYSGEYYDLQLDRNLLKLRRKSGEEIAEIPLNASADAQDKGLTKEDWVRLERLKALLLMKSQRQEHENQVDLE
ncbi:MAG: relaxase/mobilization nuclease domain-containing protein [Desmonostoc geniculatum HA4340-LM1]|nr:relaxase/mobilization nuclease domain-containing protein [Desmonostoc geniculatum HA4340-LM1]